MRLIDADAFRKEIPVDKYGHIETTITKLCIAIEHSKVDAVERKRGRWIHDGYDIPHGVDWMHCSVCGRREPHVPAAMTNFCPSCGAEMGGEENE